MITSRVSVVSARTVALFALDAVCAAAALVAATAIFSDSEGVVTLLGDVPRWLAPSLVLPTALALCGLYAHRFAAAGALVRSGIVPIAVCLASFGIGVALGGASSSIAATSVALLLPALLAVRVIGGWLRRHPQVAVKAVVVGTVDQAARILELVRAHPAADIRPVGLVFTRRQLDRAPASLGELPVLGTLDVLESAVASSRADVVLVASTLADGDPDLLRRLRALRLQGVAILDYLGTYERLAQEIPLDEVDDRWLFAAAMSCSRLHIRWLKRLVDVSVCVLLAPLAAILFGFAAVAIRLTSPGPVLFRQERLGLGGRTFWLLKLRTMRADAEKLTGPVWATDDDPRVTRAGKILRKFRLDELPQIVNVLRGDMSLVGPRPERPILARQICEKVPLFPERLLVRPGITGWAQVMAPYASTVADSHRKLQFDLYYIKNLSFWLDLFIIAKTASTMLFGRERSQGGMVAGRQLDQAAPARAIPVTPSMVASREAAESFQISQTG